MKLIPDNIDKIYAYCGKHGIKTLCVLCSILTPKFNEKSNVDFSATFYPEDNPLMAGEK